MPVARNQPSPSIHLVLLLLVVLLPLDARSGQGDWEGQGKGAVHIAPRETHIEVFMDLEGADRREIWSQYARSLLDLFPTLEADYDTWIVGIIGREGYRRRMQAMQHLKPQVPKEYQEEIEGMASQLSGGLVNAPGDGKLSLDELYFINLHVDILMSGACSALSVYGPTSATGSNMIARLVDWYPRKGTAIFTLRGGHRSVVNIAGALSVMAGTAFNEDGVFAALLAAGPSPMIDLSSGSYRSITMDIRYALEHFRTLEEVAAYLSRQPYAFSHQVFLADSKRAGVLENNLWKGGIRAVRGAESELGQGVAWEFRHAVAAVNSFFLKANCWGGGLDPRWANIRSELSQKLQHRQQGEMGQVTFDELREIATYYGRSHPGTYPGSTGGDIYNGATQQIILFEPHSFHLEVFFRNASPKPSPDPPFTLVPVSFLSPSR
jgi:hypothetical protein